MNTVVRQRWNEKPAYATPAQEAKIAELKKQYPNLQVITHHRRPEEKNKNHALISLTNKHSIWVSPTGQVNAAEPIYPFCFGNPTQAHCIASDYCERRISCSE